MFYGAGLKSEGVGAGGGFGEGVGSDGVGGEFGEVGLLLLVAGPAFEGVDDEGVLNVDEDADRGVDGGDLFDGEDFFEEGCGGAALLFRDLDDHEAELEELLEECGVHLLGFVHLADEGGDLCLRELADSVAKEALVFC